MPRIEPIPAFSDNYIWLLYDEASRHAWVVDPGDAAPVEVRLRELELSLQGILVTHHHFDHVGGLESLCQGRELVVYGPHNPAVPLVNRRLGAGDRIEVLGCALEVLEVPGHTLDHIAYRGTPPDGQPILFCGDTLFAGGCGRLFEGTPEIMYRSLGQLAALPPATRVYCAHEYTLANLAFARAVEPANGELAARERECRARRDAGEPTVPSLLEEELATNPFLRCDRPELLSSLKQQGKLEGRSGPEVFSVVRAWKDNF